MSPQLEQKYEDLHREVKDYISKSMFLLGAERVKALVAEIDKLMDTYTVTGKYGADGPDIKMVGNDIASLVSGIYRYFRAVVNNYDEDNVVISLQKERKFL